MDLATESQAAEAVWAWRNLMLHKYPDLNMLFHVPNEGKRSWVHGKLMKNSGMCAGVPDWFLPVSRHGWHGLAIEQKSANGRLTKNQSAWLSNLAEQGYMAVVCVGQDAVTRTLEDYLTQTP